MNNAYKKMITLRRISFLKKNKFARYLKNFIRIFLYKLNSLINSSKSCKTKIIYVVENANWSIKWDGEYISSEINKKFNSKIISTSEIPNLNYNNKIIHFGSQYMWIDWYRSLPKNKDYVVSFFHGKKSDSLEVEKHIEEFIKSQNSIYKVVTASSLVFERLLEWGIPKSKLEVIPIGVDTNLFSIAKEEKRLKIRKKLGFKKHEIVIGSFQKDGQGWSEGDLPKLIKGPDLFVKSVEIISKEVPVVVLLTGPSRGYVKKELSKRNIKFIHIFAKTYKEVANFYNALDLYIVSSREEGGPKAIVESMASGVPIISTNVGMARDFIVDRKNGGLVNSFEPKDIAGKSLKIINNNNKKEIINAARNDVMRADWSNVSQIYWERVYKPRIKNFIS